MGGLGTRISRGISALGRKSTNTISMIGKKTQGLEKNIKSGIDKGINLGKEGLRQTSIGIDKVSGKIGAIKQGMNVGARVIDALQMTGVAGMIPGLAPTLGAVSAGLKAGASGLQRTQDVGKDAKMALGKRSNQLSSVGANLQNRVGAVGEKSRAKLERVGERVKAIEAATQEDIGNVQSAFQG